MRRTAIALTFASILGVGGAAFAAPPRAPAALNVYGPVGPEGLLDGTEADKTTIIENGATKEVFWRALTEAQRRSLYGNQSVVIAVSKVETNGSLTVLPGSVSIGKGTYDLLYRYQLFRQVPCVPDRPEAGSVRIGVGLTIKARISSKKGSLSLANLGPLAMAASHQDAAGRIEISSVGIGGQSATLASYLGSNADISIESVTKAMEALAVVKAVLENKDVQTTASYLQLLEGTPGSCRATPNVPLKALNAR